MDPKLATVDSGSMETFGGAQTGVGTVTIRKARSMGHLQRLMQSGCKGTDLTCPNLHT